MILVSLGKKIHKYFLGMSFPDDTPENKGNYVLKYSEKLLVPLKFYHQLTLHPSYCMYQYQ